VPARLLHTEGFRLTAIFVAVFALAALALTASVLIIVTQQFQDQIVEFANADIAAVKDGYRTEGEPEAQEVIQQRMAAPGASDFFLLQRNGLRLAGNLAPMAPQTGIVTLSVPDGRAHHDVLGVGAFLAPGLYVFSGSDLEQSRRAQGRILQALVWVFAAAMLMAIGGGLLVSRSVVRRMDTISRACRAIMVGDMRTRIPIRGARDELDRLAETINAMLARIAALMENLRQVTNDIAHDLRTPVTHLRHRLERARGECATPADYDHALEQAIAASDDILGLFSALLRIAQIEGGARRAGFTSLDLGALLQHLREVFAPVAEDAGRSFEISITDSAIIAGDRELLTQLFSNLIENAIVHTPAGTRITMMLRQEEQRAVVTISDDGPGVPGDEHPKLFQRLYRREASRTTPGYGLGLALVAAIAELHGALVTTGAAPEGGFAVRISFARESQD
jgi:signal transduction histidine kinase